MSWKNVPARRGRRGGRRRPPPRPRGPPPWPRPLDSLDPWDWRRFYVTLENWKNHAPSLITTPTVYCRVAREIISFIVLHMSKSSSRLQDLCVTEGISRNDEWFYKKCFRLIIKYLATAHISPRKVVIASAGSSSRAGSAEITRLVENMSRMLDNIKQ